jgi:metal iron transporter
VVWPAIEIYSLLDYDAYEPSSVFFLITMNCPSRNDNILDHPDWNQSPNSLANDLTTRQDLNGIANLRLSRDHLPLSESNESKKYIQKNAEAVIEEESEVPQNPIPASPARSNSISFFKERLKTLWNVISLNILIPKRVREFISFIGPGFLVAVAYIDPGNYATDVAAGAETKYQLLFIVLMSNIFAVVLQYLAIRLGTVTGKNLAEHCRLHLPRWLNIFLWILAEGAIISTDIAEV